jgi:putative membrane protein insertion efficiency factor
MLFPSGKQIISRERKTMTTRILTKIIRGYQNFGGMIFPRACRFYPSCSHYAIDAVEKYGAVKGGIKTILRIARCSPLSRGGYDPLK